MDTSLYADAELVEAAWLREMVEHVAPSDHDQLGIVTADLHGGVVLSVRNDPAGGFCNRALGLGLTEPITRAVLDDMIMVFRQNQTAVALIQALGGGWQADTR